MTALPGRQGSGAFSRTESTVAAVWRRNGCHARCSQSKWRPFFETRRARIKEKECGLLKDVSF
jgi:hypothetical protein